MLPKWLKPIDNLFVAAERWTTRGRFLVMFGVAVLVMGGMTLFILSRRSDGGWIQDKCGDVRWHKADLPVPVWIEASTAEWEPDVKAGIAFIDPWGKLLVYKGVQPLGVEAPKGAITVERTNSEDHGVEHWEAVDGGGYCRMTRSQISVPGLLIPGRLRTQVAAHELGHALGLAHSDWETSIMHPKTNAIFRPKLDDANKARLATYLGPEVQ